MDFVEKYAFNTKRTNETYGMGLVRSTSIGRKRVALTSAPLDFGDDPDCILSTRLKRQCSKDLFFFSQKSALEDLPQEILIRILCCVDHDDLKRLFFVSREIRNATLLAKQYYFAYSTPQRTSMFRGGFEDLHEFEAPNAPKQSRVPRSRLNAKKLACVSVALFASDSDEG